MAVMRGREGTTRCLEVLHQAWVSPPVEGRFQIVAPADART
jgi:hypothetical protein